MRRFVGFDTDSSRWDGFEFRAGDIVISSPMKAGTTWTQMICALLVFQSSELPAPLGRLSPWLDMLTRPLRDVLDDLAAQTHRRFIKTHTPVDCLPIPAGVAVVGVGRHPLDLAASAARHSANIDFHRTLELVASVAGARETTDRLTNRPLPRTDPEARLRFFLDADENPADVLTLAGVIDHYRSYDRAAADVVRVHYSDLIADREREMRRLATALDFDIAAAKWPELVAAAGFDAMKARASVLVPDAGLGLIADAGAFFDRGADGEWRSAVSAEVVERFHERLAELDPAGEVARWACRGLYS